MIMKGSYVFLVVLTVIEPSTCRGQYAYFSTSGLSGDAGLEKVSTRDCFIKEMMVHHHIPGEVFHFSGVSRDLKSQMF